MKEENQMQSQVNEAMQDSATDVTSQEPNGANGRVSSAEQQPQQIVALDVFYIGTVVRLEGAERDVMIIGYGGKDVSGGVHDYIGVPHPFGLASTNALMAFEAKQIVGVQFFGYGNTPAQEYVAKIVHACETGELSLPMLSAD